MIPNPLALIAEITHRCPLHCVYCSNPLQMIGANAELSTQDWVRVFQEAQSLGILHLHLTGGEPVAPDPKVREFLRYMLSRQGQADVAEEGDYLPLTAAVAREQLKKVD